MLYHIRLHQPSPCTIAVLTIPWGTLLQTETHHTTAKHRDGLCQDFPPAYVTASCSTLSSILSGWLQAEVGYTALLLPRQWGWESIATQGPGESHGAAAPCSEVSPPKGRGKGDEFALKLSPQTERKRSVHLPRTKNGCFAENQFCFNNNKICIYLGRKVLATQKFNRLNWNFHLGADEQSGRCEMLQRQRSGKNRLSHNRIIFWSIHWDSLLSDTSINTLHVMLFSARRLSVHSRRHKEEVCSTMRHLEQTAP